LQFEYKTQAFEREEAVTNLDLENKSSFINVVNETKKAIASGRLKKLVVARKMTQKRGGRCFTIVYPFVDALSQCHGLFLASPKNRDMGRRNP
jgi:hypothetical protein